VIDALELQLCRELDDEINKPEIASRATFVTPLIFGHQLADDPSEIGQYRVKPTVPSVKLRIRIRGNLRQRKLSRWTS